MKTLTACLVALSIAAVAWSAPMKDMPGANAGAKTGNATGVITAIDPKTAKVTIKHGPIPAVGWPAMTMTFAAKPPALMKDLKVGQHVAFEVRTHNMDAELTAIHPR